MSVQSEIDRINGNVASTYTALSEMGATMPETQNSDNLPGTVRTVPQGGGTSVQTDWNQTDETAPDFLKNKPFGDELVDILPETELTAIEEDGLYLVPLGLSSFSSDADILDITFDGVKYSCAVVGSEYGLRLFGNANILEDGLGGAGEPFCVDPVGLLISEPALFLTDTETHIIGILGNILKKVNRKYVDTATTFYINSVNDIGYVYADNMCTIVATKDEIVNAAKNGAVILEIAIEGLSIGVLLPFFIRYTENFAELMVSHSEDNGMVKSAHYYTAEYTPTA